MKRDEKHLWSAYLDGELSASEASDFDRALSAGDRDRLDGELRLEAAIAERLADAPTCPDLLWKRVQQEVRQVDEPMETSRFALTRVLAPLTAAAAVLLIGVALFLPNGPGYLPPFLELAAADEPSAERLSETEANRAAIENYLRQTGMRIRLTSEDASGSKHSIHVVGARREVYRGKPYIRIFFQCCRKPVEMIVAHKGDPAAEAILSACEKGELRDSRLMNTYVITVVGDGYHVPEVIGLVRPD